MNIDCNKVKGLELVLKQSLNEFQHEILAVFGEDPEINDRSLFELTQSAFCIPTNKNKHLTLPSHIIRASWQEICKSRS